MSRSDRLFDIIHILRDGQLHVAKDIAQRCDVSVRTIYRDMERLVASGVPIGGTRGTGYMIHSNTTLPPLTLTQDELEALNLGIAIVSEARDDVLQSAARSLGDKIDHALPEVGLSDANAWKAAITPFSDAMLGFAHMPVVRAAIRAKQKLRVTYHSKGDLITTRIIRPLKLEHYARIWTLTAWCELRGAFRVFRLDLMQSADALPYMFVDEPGKTIDDYNTQN